MHGKTLNVCQLLWYFVLCTLAKSSSLTLLLTDSARRAVFRTTWCSRWESFIMADRLDL